MVAVRTSIFCDYTVELRLLQLRDFFDAGVLPLQQPSGSGSRVLSVVYSSAGVPRPPRRFPEFYSGRTHVELDVCNGLCRVVYLHPHPYKPEDSALVFLYLLPGASVDYWSGSADSEGVMD